MVKVRLVMYVTRVSCFDFMFLWKKKHHNNIIYPNLQTGLDNIPPTPPLIERHLNLLGNVIPFFRAE